MSEKLILSIVEIGGYDDFTPLYRRLGYRHETLDTGRKAITALQRLSPEVIVTEFNYQREFRDRTSHLESILAKVQQLQGGRVIAFYYPQEENYLAPLLARFPSLEILARPIDEAQLEQRVLASGVR